MPYKKFDAISSKLSGLTSLEARDAGVYFIGIVGCVKKGYNCYMWIPAFAGMTGSGASFNCGNGSQLSLG